MKVKHLLLVTLAFQLMFKNKKIITDFSEIAFPKRSHPTRVLSITHRVKFSCSVLHVMYNVNILLRIFQTRSLFKKKYITKVTINFTPMKYYYT